MSAKLTDILIRTGRYIENHGVIHNMWFNTTTTEKKPYYQTQFVNEWWDNGTLPIWITAQRQVCLQRNLHLITVERDCFAVCSTRNHFS